MNAALLPATSYCWVSASNGASIKEHWPGVSGLNAEQMLFLTQEPLHFEAIFLEPIHQPNIVHARVFDLFEELPFAGHSVVGTGAVLHAISGRTEPQTWRTELPEKVMSITTEQTEHGYPGLLDQGTPEFLSAISSLVRLVFSQAICIPISHLR